MNSIKNLAVNVHAKPIPVSNPSRRRASVRQYSQSRNRNNSIYAICRDDAGRTWLGTEDGLYKEIDGVFSKQVPDLISSQVNDIACDFAGNVWISTMSQGVFRMDAASEEWSNTEIGCDYVTCIMEDRVHNLWFGTKSNGIILTPHNSKESITFSAICPKENISIAISLLSSCNNGEYTLNLTLNDCNVNGKSTYSKKYANRLTSY